MAFPPQVADLASAVFAKDAIRLYGKINASLTRRVPYIGVLGKGVIDANVAVQLTAVTQGLAASGGSMVAPVATNMSSVIDNSTTLVDQTGTFNYNYRAKIISRTSERINVNQTFESFLGAVRGMYDSIAELSTQLINADIRWEIFQRSGLKIVVKSGVTIDNLFTGGYGQIDTALPNTVSDAPLSWGLIKAIQNVFRQDFDAEAHLFGNGAQGHLRLVSDKQTLDAIRAEAGFINPNYWIAASGDGDAKKALKEYQYEGPFYGVAFGVDPKPIRGNYVDDVFTTVEPYVVQAGSTGNVYVPNPLYGAATHTVSFLFADKSFVRETLANYTGEAPAKFIQQNFGGQLMFRSILDNGANFFGDFGAIGYRIGRGIRPNYPWHCLPIVHQRCANNNTVTKSCADVTAIV